MQLWNCCELLIFSFSNQEIKTWSQPTKRKDKYPSLNAIQTSLHNPAREETFLSSSYYTASAFLPPYFTPVPEISASFHWTIFFINYCQHWDLCGESSNHICFHPCFPVTMMLCKQTCWSDKSPFASLDNLSASAQALQKKSKSRQNESWMTDCRSDILKTYWISKCTIKIFKKTLKNNSAFGKMQHTAQSHLHLL